MKASTFIKVALVDQMQQIADLGLWFHVAKLIPAGVEALGVVVYGMGDDFEEEYLGRLARSIYGDFFPLEYVSNGYPTGKGFFSTQPKIWLCHEDETSHFKKDEEGRVFIHVPTWFADFKNACNQVLKEIENGKIEDVEVLKTLEQ